MSTDEFVAVLAYLVMSVTMVLGALEMWQTKTLAGRRPLGVTLFLLAVFFLLLAAGLIVLRYHAPMPEIRAINRFVIGAAAITSLVFLFTRYGRRIKNRPV